MDGAIIKQGTVRKPDFGAFYRRLPALVKGDGAHDALAVRLHRAPVAMRNLRVAPCLRCLATDGMGRLPSRQDWKACNDRRGL